MEEIEIILYNIVFWTAYIGIGIIPYRMFQHSIDNA